MADAPRVEFGKDGHPQPQPLRGLEPHAAGVDELESAWGGSEASAAVPETEPGM